MKTFANLIWESPNGKEYSVQIKDGNNFIFIIDPSFPMTLDEAKRMALIECQFADSRVVRLSRWVDVREPDNPLVFEIIKYHPSRSRQ